MEHQEQALLNAVLAHVPFDGMNQRAIDAGARDIGMSADLARVIFPQGGASLAAAYHRRGDRALREWLAATPPEGRFRDRIAATVWQRLHLADREMVRAGSAVMALPGNAVLGARLIWETADAIWAGLGDTSEDVNWYSKRATLSAVYAATVLYWLGDDSGNWQATRDFLDRRIEGVMQFEKFKAGMRKLPGVSAITGLATGWIKAPGPRDLPGRMHK